MTVMLLLGLAIAVVAVVGGLTFLVWSRLVGQKENSPHIQVPRQETGSDEKSSQHAAGMTERKAGQEDPPVVHPRTSEPPGVPSRGKPAERHGAGGPDKLGSSPSIKEPPHESEAHKMIREREQAYLKKSRMFKDEDPLHDK